MVSSATSSSPLLAAATPSYAATTTTSTPSVDAQVNTASTPLLNAADRNVPPIQPTMRYQIPGCHNQQTQAAFDLMLDMLQSNGFSISAKPTDPALSVDQLAKAVLDTADRRAGGPLSKEEIDTVKLFGEEKMDLTREKVAKLFCHQSLKKDNKKDVLYKPNFPPERTYKAALAMYTNGRDSSPEGQKRWRDGFHDDILYITAGRLPGISGVTEDKASTLKDLEAKAKKAPHLDFDVYRPLVMGNMAMAIVDNKTPTGPGFALAGLTFFEDVEVTSDDGKKTMVAKAICNVDVYSSDDAIGAMLKHYWNVCTSWCCCG